MHTLHSPNFSPLILLPLSAYPTHPLPSLSLMAASLDQASQTRKKRKRKEPRRRLLVRDNVEVRSTEEGFHGSWHPATVIECRDLVRVVRYNHILVDEGTENLTESITVSCMVDGVDVEVPVNYRGVMRPVPPPLKTPICGGVWGFYYGLCVDVYYNDAWWEGVIFDHEDGSEERLVLFPDLGDVQLAKIENLRVTQDWDEIRDSWKTRGDWLFLELIEELEKKMFVSVSVRQLWYDARAKEAFRVKIKEWTCWVRPFWDDMVLEVIRDNINLTAEHFLDVILSGNAVNFVGNSSKMTSGSNRSDATVPCDGILQDKAKENKLALVLSGPRTRSRSGNRSYTTLACEDIIQGQTEENQHVLTSLGPSRGTRSGIRNSKSDGSLPAEAILQDHVEDNQFALTPSCKSKRSRYDVISDSALPCDGIVQSHVEEDQLPLASLEETMLECRTGSSDLLNETKKIKCQSELENGGHVDESATLRFQFLKDPYGCPIAINEDLRVPPIRKTKDSSFLDNLMEDGDHYPKAVTLPEVDADPINQEGGVGQDSKERCWVRVDPTQYKGKLREFMNLERNNWLFTESGNYPSAPIDYLHSTWKKSAARKVLRDKVRMHLSYLGWGVVRFHDVNSTIRVKYISPEEKVFYSLIPVCRLLTEDTSVHSMSINDHQAAFPHTLEEHNGSEEEAAVRGISCISESLALDFPVETVNYEPEFCPDAVVELYGLGPSPKNVGNLRFKAKKHLSAIGWTFRYINKNEGRELRYDSPNGKSYASLRQACKGCIEEALSAGTKPNQRIVIDEASKRQLNSHNLSSAVISCSEKSRISESGETEYSNLVVKRAWGHQMRRNKNAFSFTKMAPRKSDFGTRSYSRQDRKSLAFSCSKIQRKTFDQSPDSQEKRKRKIIRVLTRKGVEDGSCPSRVLRSSKRARKIKAPNPGHYCPRTILSWLIDNNVVLPREKVYYKGRNQQRSLAEGKITRDGIKCNCCHKVYSISSFEAHAGGTCRRPAASIFLEDGRSLLDCQKQMVQDIKLMSSIPEPYQRIKCNRRVKNDCICSVCHYGGILVLCDQCPSSFHLNCVGLESLPNGKWFCPSCRCGICGQSEFNGNIDQFTDKTVLYCDQCEREYHVGCLKKRGMVLNSCPREHWFCSAVCEKIFIGLHKLLGKSIPVGFDDLSWTILKFQKDGNDKDALSTEAMTEHHSKLNVALAVMHECFEPIKEPQTKDLVKDVIFNEGSVLKRLNFRGFYTVLLEKNDELVSVATVRVYGEKVAEVPLVGTRVQFRRQGMCSILMNLLEKKLMEIGVERLVLPAIPQILQAWTTSFGFSKMTNSERMKFLEYIFLDFQDTTMCQKLLKIAPTLKIIGPRGKDHGLENRSNLNEDVAKVLERGDLGHQITQPNEQSDFMKPMRVEVTSHADCSSIQSPPVLESTEMLWGTYESWSRQNDDMQKEDKGSGNACLKYYKRRKKSYSSCDPISSLVATN